MTHPDYSSIYVILRPVVAWIPAGIAWAAIRGAMNRATSPSKAALLASIGHSFVEAGRAFTAYRHPDVTNVLMAALGAYFGVRIFTDLLAQRKIERSV